MYRETIVYYLYVSSHFKYSWSLTSWLAKKILEETSRDLQFLKQLVKYFQEQRFLDIFYKFDYASKSFLSISFLSKKFFDFILHCNVG